jgi:hypothetical protein
MTGTVTKPLYVCSIYFESRLIPRMIKLTWDKKIYLLSLGATSKF